MPFSLKDFAEPGDTVVDFTTGERYVVPDEPVRTMEARHVRVGDIIDGHEVIDSQKFLTAMVGATIEFYFADREPLTLRLSTDVEVVRASDEEYGYAHATRLA